MNSGVLGTASAVTQNDDCEPSGRVGIAVTNKSNNRERIQIITIIMRKQGELVWTANSNIWKRRMNADESGKPETVLRTSGSGNTIALRNAFGEHARTGNAD